MSNPPHTTVTKGEALPLTSIAGSGDTCIQIVSSLGQHPAFCRDDKYHRRLAIGSIICGITCIGITALINSVKAETATDPESMAKFSKRARKFGIISIVVWVSLLALIPVLMALFSYLATLKN